MASSTTGFSSSRGKKQVKTLGKQDSLVCYCATVPAWLAAYAIHSFPHCKSSLTAKRISDVHNNTEQKVRMKLSIIMYNQEYFFLHY